MIPPRPRRLSEQLIDRMAPQAVQIDRLLDITDALIRHAERDQSEAAGAFARFRRSADLEELVRQRTHDLEATLRHLAEANAQAERARRNMAQAIEAVEEGFAMFDPSGRLVMYNSRFCRLLGDVRAQIHPNLSIDAFIAMASRSAHLVLPAGMQPDDWIDYRLKRHQQGQRLNIELTGDRWLQVTEQATAEGGIVILQTDITETIRAERAERGKLLDKQAQMIRATLEHIDQGVAIFDAKLFLAGCNRRFAELFNLPSSLLRAETSFARLATHLVRQVQFGDDFSGHELLRWLRLDQRRPSISFELRLSTGVVLGVFGQGMPGRGFVLSFTDVTRERMAIQSMLRAHDQLEARVAARTSDLAIALQDAEQAHASRVRFVAAASHDLLQPLSAAKLFVAAARDMAAPGRPAETLEKAHNAMASVEAILGALLDISRLDGTKTAVEEAPIAFAVLLPQLAEEFMPMAQQRGLDLRILPSALTVTSDPAYLRRILQNLISNALRYTQTGKVLVGLRRNGTRVRLEVHDTGPGIAPQDREKIFGEFQRLQGSASAAEGMGLGLAIVKRACTLLRHPLTLQSVPGRGTCFAIDLPLAPMLAKRPVLGPTPGLSEEPEPHLERIALLVENDDDLRRAMALLLEQRGISVLEAESGEAALALLEEIGIVPDLYLLDYQLGDGMDGVETALALNAEFGTRPLRIITANRSTEVRQRAQSQGFELLYKPIDPDVLEGIIRQADA